MTPAEGEPDLASRGQGVVAGITVYLQHAMEAGEMGSWPLRLAVWRIDIGDARRIGAAPRPVVPGISPELADLRPSRPGSSTGAVVSSANSFSEPFSRSGSRPCTGRSKKAARRTQSARVERSRATPWRA
jgi:hypothetical protein